MRRAGRRCAGVAAGIAILLVGGYFAASAPSRSAADSPLIVLDQSIGGVAIGMSQAEVEALYGKPDDTLTIALRGGGTGLLAHYHVHGGVLIVVYAQGRVVSIETDAAFYRTEDGLGAGTSKAGVHGFHEDFCSGGLWDGSPRLPLDGVVTVFQRNGDEIAEMSITVLGYYDLCQSEGTGQNVADPRPKKSHLTVTIDPNGGGYVQSGGLEVDCPLACSKELDTDATITLTAHPTNGFTFVGWSGACSGAGSCTVTLDGPTHVTAHFEGEYVPPEAPPKTPPTTTTTPCRTRCGGFQ